jgi:hypothetical protein
MTITIQPVPQHFIAQTWPMVERFIAKAMKFSGGDYSLDQIKMYLSQGTWLLLVAVDEEKQVHGAMTVSFINYPNNRVAYVTTTGGKGICTADALKQMKSIVSSMGATKVQAGGRPAMVRMLSRLGFSQRYTVVEAGI